MAVAARVFRRSLLLPVGLLLIGCASLRAAEHDTTASALNSITGPELQHHVDVLADDSLEGREAGSRGGHAAGDYLVQFLKSNHIQPAGDNGTYFQEFGNGYRNILCRIEGRDPALKHQFILIGAHYDHVGYGTRRNSFGPIGQIHNGADDNASGTSGVLEVVQAFTFLPHAPRRSVLFALWDGEEKGLLGSRHWTSHLTVALDDVKFAFNVDMIGRMHADHLEVFGARTAPGLRQLVSRQNVGLGLDLNFNSEIKANADHYSFFERRIPYLMFHTGLHPDYHRPTDDADKINSIGLEHVARLMFRVAWQLAEEDASVPAFRTASRYEAGGRPDARPRVLPPAPPRLGIQWNPAKDGAGVLVTGVTGGSPADRAGLQVGDRITRFAGRAIREPRQFPLIVLAAPASILATVRHDGDDKPRKLTVQLDGAPLRVGISWQTDDGEPHTVVLTRVVTGSPADRAGLKPGDRIYEVNGQPIADEPTLRARLLDADTDLRLLRERAGRLKEVHLELLEKNDAS